MLELRGGDEGVHSCSVGIGDFSKLLSFGIGYYDAANEL